MKSITVAFVAFLLTPAALTLAAVAQPRDPPPEFLALIDTIEEDTGLKRFGAPKISDVGDGESVTFKMKVDRTKLTYLQLACDGYCIEMKPSVTTSSSAVITPDLPDNTLPVIQVPAGSGDEVDLTVEMACEYAFCTFGVQALTQ